MRCRRTRFAAAAPPRRIGAAALFCVTWALRARGEPLGPEALDTALVQAAASPSQGGAVLSEQAALLAGLPGHAGPPRSVDGPARPLVHGGPAARIGREDGATSAHDSTIGYLCCLISCLGFGSSYIPVKQVDVRDGMFFTLCLSFGVLCVGALQWLASGLYRFEPFAMLGGALWATGNLCVPFIIKNCGLGIGQLVWSVTNMLTGWATGNFGLFGKDKDVVAHPSLNYFGVLVAIMSLGLFKFMKGTSDSSSGGASEGRSANGFALGFVVALVTGAFFGSNFNPPTYLQQLGQRDQAAGLPPAQWRHSPYATDYVFSHFAGIFATTAIAFVAYAAASRGRLYAGRDVVLPGVISGAVWAVAQVAWFKANGVLSYVVAFPIIVGVPGLIAAVWGVVLFGENRGRHNLTVLALVIAVQTVAVTLIAASKG